MSFDLAQRRCPVCDCSVLAVQLLPNHIFHLLMSIATAGIWLIVWIIRTLKARPWLCTRCGSHTEFLGDIRL